MLLEERLCHEPWGEIPPGKFSGGLGTGLALIVQGDFSERSLRNFFWRILLELPLLWAAARLRNLWGGPTSFPSSTFSFLPWSWWFSVFCFQFMPVFRKKSSKSLSVFGTTPCFTRGPAALQTRQAHGSSFFPGEEPVLSTTDRGQCKLRGWSKSHASVYLNTVQEFPCYFINR